MAPHLSQFQQQWMIKVSKKPGQITDLWELWNCWEEHSHITDYRIVIWLSSKPLSHESLIFSRITNWKKWIVVAFGLFLGKFERIANSKCEFASELSYTDQSWKRKPDSCLVGRGSSRSEITTKLYELHNRHQYKLNSKRSMTIQGAGVPQIGQGKASQLTRLRSMHNWIFFPDLF